MSNYLNIVKNFIINNILSYHNIYYIYFIIVSGLIFYIYLIYHLSYNNFLFVLVNILFILYCIIFYICYILNIGLFFEMLDYVENSINIIWNMNINFLYPNHHLKRYLNEDFKKEYEYHVVESVDATIKLINKGRFFSPKLHLLLFRDASWDAKYGSLNMFNFVNKFIIENYFEADCSASRTAIIKSIDNKITSFGEVWRGYVIVDGIKYKFDLYLMYDHFAMKFMQKDNLFPPLKGFSERKSMLSLTSKVIRSHCYTNYMWDIDICKNDFVFFSKEHRVKGKLMELLFNGQCVSIDAMPLKKHMFNHAFFLLFPYNYNDLNDLKIVDNQDSTIKLLEKLGKTGHRALDK